MLDIQKIRDSEVNIIAIGSYPAIIQSILDFDFYSKRGSPSIRGIIAAGRQSERYYFGKKEILIPVYSSLEDVPEEKIKVITYFLNLSSGRRVLTSSIDAIDSLPALIAGVVFAENVPEKHAIELREYANDKEISIIGPASVGLIIPSVIKLGAIGGVDHKQIIAARLFEKGSVAVLSASGGMTNEIINIVTSRNLRLSFSLSFGGDRYPVTRPRDAFLVAEKDPDTRTVVYFGELGGRDEYEVVEMLQTGKFTKKVICYIAGVVAEMFPTSPQFGHAKAMAATTAETARAKRSALKNAGAGVAESFGEFVEMIENLEPDEVAHKKDIIEPVDNRKKALIASSISKDEDGKVVVLGEELLDFAKGHSFGYIVASLFLGKKINSQELEDFVNFILKLLVEHGPYVSGAVNTIVTSRAGRDLVSSLASGLLTIGPRFGGAINQAAKNFIEGATSGKTASEFVEDFASKKIYIAGIGHKKYRVDFPDPRVAEILSYSNGLSAKFTNFAKEVEKVTAAKKGNLILNVDGAIAAVLLDILHDKENYSEKDLARLADTEFFNGLFVASRSIGFIAHFLDQKRLDEGIFRLEEDHVADAST